MTVPNRIAHFQNRRNELPNQELARVERVIKQAAAQNS